MSRAPSSPEHRVTKTQDQVIWVKPLRHVKAARQWRGECTDKLYTPKKNTYISKPCSTNSLRTITQSKLQYVVTYLTLFYFQHTHVVFKEHLFSTYSFSCKYSLTSSYTFCKSFQYNKLIVFDANISRLTASIQNS